MHFRKVIALESVMSIRTIILVLLLSLTVVKAINMNIADPFTFVCTAYGAAILFVATIASIIAGNKANKAKESVMKTVITLILIAIATPASAFAQAYQENVMPSTTTTSVIANAFTALILSAFVAGGFAGIYTMVSRTRKAFKFGVTAVLTLVGAAFIIALAGMMLPYTNTGYVAQDMVAISMFSAIVLFSGMTAVVWRADNTLTAKEKAKIAAEKARIAAAEAAHQAEIDSVNELAHLIDTLRIMAEFSEGKYMKNVVCPTLSSKLDWKNGVNRSRYMGYWPSDK